MINLKLKSFLLLTCICCSSTISLASPCDPIDRTLTTSKEKTLEVDISKEIGFSKSIVLQSFEYQGWSIVDAKPQGMEDAFLFYSGAPETNRRITLWGGVAIPTEEKSIHAWAVQNAPGIPNVLAECFAWHVSHERNE